MEYETNKINGKTHLNLDSIRISTLELNFIFISLDWIAFNIDLNIASF